MRGHYLTNKKTMTKTMTMTKKMTNTIPETCDIWDTNYNSDNWEPEFITIFVAWQLRVTLDSISNSFVSFPFMSYCVLALRRIHDKVKDIKLKYDVCINQIDIWVFWEGFGFWSKTFHSCLFGLGVLHRYPPAPRSMPTAVTEGTQNFRKVCCADGNEVNDAYSPQFKV